MTTEHLEKTLHSLGFYYLATHSADFCALLTKRKLSPYEAIEHLARLEQQERLARGAERRIKAASLGRFRPIAEFDWAWPRKIDRTGIEALMTMNFVAEPANVILFGPAGVGKTMIAKNLAYQGALAGHSALYTHASDMLSDLEQQDSPRLLRLRINRYVRPKILVVDEVGYLSYTSRSADLLFQVITRRHEKSSTIITTNLAFKDWNTIFPGAGCMSALIDRLTHRIEAFSIEGDSYRRKESSERKKQKPVRKKQ